MSVEPIPVVVPHWNSPITLRRTLAGLGSQSHPVCVLVVDNSSDANARAEAVEVCRQEGIRISLAEPSIGFAAAANRGIDEFADLGRGVIVVAHDVILSPDAVTIMNNLVTPQVGLIAASDGDDTVGRWDWAHSVHLERYQDGVGFEWLVGHCIWLTSSFLERSGGYDERFWTWYEDVDLGLRARKLGLESVLATAAVAENFGQPSIRGGSRQYLDARNSVLMARTYRGRLAATARTALVIGKATTDWLRQIFGQPVVFMGEPKDAREYIVGALDGLRGRVGRPPHDFEAR